MKYTALNGAHLMVIANNSTLNKNTRTQLVGHCLKTISDNVDLENNRLLPVIMHKVHEANQQVSDIIEVWGM